MKIEKRRTETYVLTALDGLDPVTVYATNYELGKGKIIIECYGEAWTAYWGAMGPNTLQEFVVKANNDYLLNKLLKETQQIDFAKICTDADTLGYDLCVTNDVELAMVADEMTECFGEDWYMNLPMCNTQEYNYLERILTTIKGAFSSETH